MQHWPMHPWTCSRYWARRPPPPPPSRQITTWWRLESWSDGLKSFLLPSCVSLLFLSLITLDPWCLSVGCSGWFLWIAQIHSHHFTMIHHIGATLAQAQMNLQEWNQKLNTTPNLLPWEKQFSSSFNELGNNAKWWTRIYFENHPLKCTNTCSHTSFSFHSPNQIWTSRRMSGCYFLLFT